MSQYQFYLRVLSRTGQVKRAAVTDFLSVSYRMAVNEAGRLDLALDGDHPLVATLADFDLVEFWWKNDNLGIPWHADFEGIYREPEWSTDNDGLTLFTAKCPGQMSILDYRIVAWRADVSNRSSFAAVPAETVAKTLVSYNCTSLATVANGRLREGNLATNMGFTIINESDLGRGDLITLSFENANLLEAISKDIAPIAGGDFSFVRSPDLTTQALWRFEFHPGQLGLDKSTTVEFSLAKGNMRNPRLRKAKLNERTVTIAGGQGDGPERPYQVVTGDGYSATNDLEMSTDARLEPLTDGIIARGKLDLTDREAIDDFSFDVLQTPQVFYYRGALPRNATYKLGDLVKATYQGSRTRKITAVIISARPSDSENPFQIAVETADVKASVL